MKVNPIVWCIIEKGQRSQKMETYPIQTLFVFSFVFCEESKLTSAFLQTNLHNGSSRPQRPQFRWIINDFSHYGCQSVSSDSKTQINLRINADQDNGTFKNFRNPVSIARGDLFEVECLSRYPVALKFHGLMATRIFNLQKSRSALVPGDSEGNFCFRIQASIISAASATGLYECANDAVESSDNPVTDSSFLYIYAAGETSPHLLLAEYRTPLYILVRSKFNEPLKDVILPCVSNNPAVGIHLIQNEQIIMSSDKQSLYNPMSGFTLSNFTCGASFRHNYTCSLNLDDNSPESVARLYPTMDDYFQKYRLSLRIHVECVEENESTTLARFEKTNYNGQPEVRCWNAANMVSVQCGSVEECEFLKSCGKYPFQTICNKDQKIQSCRDGNHGCLTINTSTVEEFRGLIFCFNNQNMATGQIFSDVTGLKAWDIDFKSGTAEPPRTPGYNKWMNLICTDFNTLKNVDEFIQHETYGFQCNASQVLSADGIEWIFQLRNGSLIPAYTSDKRSILQEGIYVASAKVTFGHTEIIKLICMAPIFYSDGWTNFSHPVSVGAYIPVEPQNWRDENKTVYTNTTIDLECSGYGSRVAFAWKQNNKNITGPNHVWTRRKPGSRVLYSTITLAHDAYSTTPLGSVDNYSCTAYDPVTHNNHTTVFHVVWQNPPHSAIGPQDLGGIPYWAAGLSIIFILTILCISLILGYKYWKPISKYLELKEQRRLFYFGDRRLLGKVEGTPYDGKLEIWDPENNLKPGEYLNQGNFGKVTKAELTLPGKENRILTVVIKTPLPDCDATDLGNFLKEIKTQLKLKHENIVKVYGAVTKDIFRMRNRQDPQLVFEFMRYGDMWTALRRLRAEDFHDQVNRRRQSKNSREEIACPFERLPSISTSTLLQWCGQVASGMDYLNKMIVHRDLAARNIFITGSGNELIAKIGDFGLSRILQKVDERAVKYYTHNGTPASGMKEIVPPRWLAPEVLEAIVSKKDTKYSEHSDIWAFGVFAWEVFSLCEDTPYEEEDELPTNDNIEEELHNFLSSGGKLKRPLYANQNIYEIMKKCWKLEKTHRPSFLDLQKQLGHAQAMLKN